jgi:hypothetical protein
MTNTSYELGRHSVLGLALPVDALALLLLDDFVTVVVDNARVFTAFYRTVLWVCVVVGERGRTLHSCGLRGLVAATRFLLGNFKRT